MTDAAQQQGDELTGATGPNAATAAPARPATTGCECVSAGWCQRHGILKVGRLFELCRHDPRYFAMWERGQHQRQGGPAVSGPAVPPPVSPAAPPAAVDYSGNFPCIHRGPIRRTESCKACGQRNETAVVHWCSVHGECTIRAHGLRRIGGKLPICLSCLQRQDHRRYVLVIRDELCLGDIAVLAAAVRELVEQHRDKIRRVVVRSNHSYLLEGGGASGLSGIDVVGEPLDGNGDGNPLPEDAIELPAHYDAEAAFPGRSDVFATINNSSQRPSHFLEAYCEGLSAALGARGVSIPPLRPEGWLEPAIRLTDDEKGWLPQVHHQIGDKPFWLINAGRKNDYTAKQWYGYQEVVSRTAGQINWVQVGGAEDSHSPLDGAAVNLVGQTDGRQLVRLVYHAAGVLCGVTGLAHLAHWVEHPEGHLRHAVVIGGGRESPHWYAYPGQQVFHTIGQIDCCAFGGCWKSRVVALGDGDSCDSSLCQYPEEGVPRCMRLVDPSGVARAVLRLAPEASR